MESKDLKVVINGNGPRPSISSQVIVAIMEQAERIDANPYADINITVQAGRPVLTRITTTHKPRASSDPEPAHWLYYPPTARRSVPLAGRPCFGGLSVDGRGEESSLVLLFPPAKEDAEWMVLDWTAIAECGKAVDVRTVVGNMTRLAQQYSPVAVGYDPFGPSATVRQMEANGVPVVEIRQGARTTTRPLRHLISLMDDKRIISLVPQVCGMGSLFLCEDGSGNLRPDHNKSTGITSPIEALVNAMAVALVHMNG